MMSENGVRLNEKSEHLRRNNPTKIFKKKKRN
jgi:hypothetical protein